VKSRVQAVDGAYTGSAFAPEETIGNLVAVDEETPRQVSFGIAGANPAI
jgi:hypothetical protein